MRMKKALLPAGAAVLAASCSDFHTTWLEVGVGAGYGNDIFEIEIKVPGEPLRRLTAINFRGRLNNTVDHIEVPKEGTATIFVKLHQHGELVAEGYIAWHLDTGVERWVLLVARAPVAFGVAIYEDDPTPGCHFPWCHQIERIEIDEAARTSPDEALWLVLDRHSRGGWEVAP